MHFSLFVSIDSTEIIGSVSVLDNLVARHICHELEVQREDVSLVVYEVVRLITETFDDYTLVLLAIVNDLLIFLAESLNVLVVLRSHLLQNGRLIGRRRQKSQHSLHAVPIVCFYYLIFLQR